MNNLFIFDNNISKEKKDILLKSFKKLHLIRNSFNMENILRDEEIQFYQQELWSQPRDRTKHFWYLFKGCLCAEKNKHLLKNGYRFVHKDCSLHLNYHEKLLKEQKIISSNETDVLKCSTNNYKLFQIIQKD